MVNDDSHTGTKKAAPEREGGELTALVRTRQDPPGVGYTDGPVGKSFSPCLCSLEPSALSRQTPNVRTSSFFVTALIGIRFWRLLLPVLALGL